MKFIQRLAILTALLTLAGGCTTPSTLPAPKAESEHKPKHGGVLAEWGAEEYHPEFTVDHDKKEATVYILDGEVDKAAPIAAEEIKVTITNVKPPVTVTLKAKPLDGEAKGTASRFAGTDEVFGKVMEFTGEISGKVGDTPYAGKFEEKAHAHKHEKK